MDYYSSKNLSRPPTEKYSYLFNYKPETIPTLQNMYNFKDSHKYKAGSPYSNYDDIVGGNISYHKNRRPLTYDYSAPNFMNKNVVTYTQYIDPMGSFKPEYKRILRENDNKGQLTWIQDSCEWREDLMSRQQRKFNQSAYNSNLNIY
jgi:hypothetical protein